MKANFPMIEEQVQLHPELPKKLITDIVFSTFQDAASNLKLNSDLTDKARDQLWNLKCSVLIGQLPEMNYRSYCDVLPVLSGATWREYLDLQIYDKNKLLMGQNLYLLIDKFDERYQFDIEDLFSSEQEKLTIEALYDIASKSMFKPDSFTKPISFFIQFADYLADMYADASLEFKSELSSIMQPLLEHKMYEAYYYLLNIVHHGKSNCPPAYLFEVYLKNKTLHKYLSPKERMIVMLRDSLYEDFLKPDFYSMPTWLSQIEHEVSVPNKPSLFERLMAFINKFYGIEFDEPCYSEMHRGGTGVYGCAGSGTFSFIEKEIEYSMTNDRPILMVFNKNDQYSRGTLIKQCTDNLVSMAFMATRSSDFMIEPLYDSDDVSMLNSMGKVGIMDYDDFSKVLEEAYETPSIGLLEGIDLYFVANETPFGNADTLSSAIRKLNLNAVIHIGNVFQADIVTNKLALFKQEDSHLLKEIINNHKIVDECYIGQPITIKDCHKISPSTYFEVKSLSMEKVVSPRKELWKGSLKYL